MPKKLRIYLDTSVINASVDTSCPERQQLPLYEVFISDAVCAELQATKERSRRETLLKLIEGFAILSSESDEIETLAHDYLQAGMAPERYLLDAIHVAVATVNRLDLLVSWNFRHLVNIRARRVIQAVNLMKGYPPLDIVEPSMMVLD